MFDILVVVLCLNRITDYPVRLGGPDEGLEVFVPGRDPFPTGRLDEIVLTTSSSACWLWTDRRSPEIANGAANS
jgi:hypothetical protein